ncbi:MAG: acyl carrier protein [Desulfobacteraceae bacterium]|nr:acyl carrier protein [Desulfobacteraceae bacterium]
MHKSEFLMLLDEIIEAAPGTIQETDLLSDVDGWDSMAVMGLIAVVDETFGIMLVPEKIAASKTVRDILSLLNGQLE